MLDLVNTNFPDADKGPLRSAFIYAGALLQTTSEAQQANEKTN